MAILKCKMCGGNLNILEGETVCECDYCGSKQTVPTLDNEKKATLFTRANRLRAMCEFDKSFSVYESIVAEFPEEAEAYWGLILCKYGIEYVDDPATAKKIPTCHRSSFDPVLEDPNFEMVMEYADAVARNVYRAEAKEIERLRSGILEVSAKEPPYDIFICYKETDENGDRTIDSVIAQDVYTALTEKGYRVFFSRITLEDKLGQEYEPYIFAALHSAKIMLVFGTDYEYFNAVWVKNEWSRFLALMAKGEKKALIPCYKNVDAYDMPQEFRRLQAQDMGKVGAIQDLIRGIEKILPRQKAEAVKEPIIVQQSTAAPLVKRAFMFLAEREWNRADEYFEKALDSDPETGDAYLGKLMAEYKICSVEEFEHKAIFDLKNVRNYQYAMKFAFPDKKIILERIEERNSINVARLMFLAELRKVAKKQESYEKAEALATEDSEESQNNAAKLFDRISSFKDSKQKSIECSKRAEILRQKSAYDQAIILEEKGDFDSLLKAVKLFNGILCYRDAEIRREKCYSIINQLGERRAEQVRIVSGIIAAGLSHTVSLKEDGTIIAAGSNNFGQCNVTNWTNIISLAAEGTHTIGLRDDGTVIATGYNYDGQCDVSRWSDIVSISTGERHTIGLKKNGSVVAVGERKDGKCDVCNWKNIISISAGKDHTVGLKENGMVVATGNNDYNQCDVTDWTNIIAIAAGSIYTAGLKADGTIVVAGKDFQKTANYASNKIVYITSSSSGKSIIGLCSDGAAVEISNNFWKKYNLHGFDNLIAVAAGPYHVVGVRANGTVVATSGSIHDDSCNVSNWKLFDNIESYVSHKQEKARQKAEETERLRRAEKERQREEAARLRAENLRKQKEISNNILAVKQHMQAAETELANLKGLFTGRRRKELEAQIAQAHVDIERLEAELERWK